MSHRAGPSATGVAGGAQPPDQRRVASMGACVAGVVRSPVVTKSRERHRDEPQNPGHQQDLIDEHGGFQGLSRAALLLFQRGVRPEDTVTGRDERVWHHRYFSTSRRSIHTGAAVKGGVT